MSLDVDKLLYTKTFPSFNKPEVVAFFSVDGDRNYTSGLSQLKYVYYPKKCDVCFNLNQRIDSVIRKDEDVEEKLDHVLRCILEFKYFSRFPRNRESFTDFVCFRGLLTTIMCTPYEMQDGWIICAMKWKGIIFLCAKETEEHIQKRREVTPFQEQTMSWGYKFEQYMTTDKPGTLPITDSPVNEREEFCVMFQTKLETHRLTFGAEMDGVKSNTELHTLDDIKKTEFIELKTTRHIETQRQDQTFKRFKLLKWWCQSFLVGISTILVGFRDDRGIVSKLAEYRVRDLHKMAKGLWDPCVCMNFCVEFLNFVKRVMQDADEHTVWKFEWKPRDSVRATKVYGPSELTFLPQWFLENFNSQFN